MQLHNCTGHINITSHAVATVRAYRNQKRSQEDAYRHVSKWAQNVTGYNSFLHCRGLVYLSVENVDLRQSQNQSFCARIGLQAM
jgi:hypothetical protein